MPTCRSCSLSIPDRQWNPHLNKEYLAVLESTHGTPYYLNLHWGDVAHALLLGATGSGKSFLTSFLLQSAQKYQPLTFIFDLGGSYETLTRTFGGTYLNVGLKESRLQHQSVLACADAREPELSVSVSAGAHRGRWPL